MEYITPHFNPFKKQNKTDKQNLGFKKDLKIRKYTLNYSVRDGKIQFDIQLQHI